MPPARTTRSSQGAVDRGTPAAEAAGGVAMSGLPNRLRWLVRAIEVSIPADFTRHIINRRRMPAEQRFSFAKGAIIINS